MSELLARFGPTITSASEDAIRNDPTLGGSLVLDRDGSLVVSYAPFEHIEMTARVVVLGITPGAQQAANALLAVRRALISGSSYAASLASAKVYASFSGVMRSNLVAMLNQIGLSKWAGVSTSELLWDEKAGIGHFTSALRYPVFVDCVNYAGNPAMTRTPILLRFLKECLLNEALALPRAVWIPLGPKASEAARWLVAEGALDRNCVLDGLPHPSGANAERVAYFLGRKHRDSLSAKTNASSLDQARSRLTEKVAALSMPRA